MARPLATALAAFSRFGRYGPIHLFGGGGGLRRDGTLQSRPHHNHHRVRPPGIGLAADKVGLTTTT